jgi:hypothetical protein
MKSDKKFVKTIEMFVNQMKDYARYTVGLNPARNFPMLMVLNHP